MTIIFVPIRPSRRNEDGDEYEETEENKINEKTDCPVCEHAYLWHRKTTSGRICDFLECSCVVKN